MRHNFYETKDRASAQFCCFDCGAFYVLTAEQQEWVHNKGHALPKRCEACRAAKREQPGEREAPSQGGASPLSVVCNAASTS